MQETQTVWSMIQDGLLGLFLVAALALINYTATAIRTKYLNQAELTKVQLLEKAADTAVRAAEQKIEKVSDLVTDLLGDKPTGANEAFDYAIKYNEAYKDFKILTNTQKKNMVIDFLRTKFPDVPFAELEIQLERAYKEYKDGY